MTAINLATDNMSDLVLVVNDAVESVTDHESRLTDLENPPVAPKSGSVLLAHYTATANSEYLPCIVRNAQGQSGILLQPDFETYEIVINGFVPMSTNASLFLQFSYDGGITWTPTNYVGSYFFQGSDGSTGSAPTGNPGCLLADSIYLQVETGVTGSGKIHNPCNTSIFTTFHGAFVYRNNTNMYYYFNRVHCEQEYADDANSFRLVFTPNINIMAGTVTVYGLNK